jgi:succinate dehydrogenase / fumarate reductase iron-sulfur subunit
VTDVSLNYRINKKIPAFTPRENTDWKMQQEDIDRVQEFRKCIECFLCQNVCHVLRDHQKTEEFGGPRFFVRVAGLDMHPLDSVSRIDLLKDELGIGFCNITKCCTEVCPEDIHITDNAIIPLKERVVDDYYDPVMWVIRKLTGKGRK